ncbi:MAG TPA: hypothetical protein VIS29_06435 [Streptomyces sp.]
MAFAIDDSRIVRSDRYERRTMPLSSRNGDVYVVPHHSVTYTRSQTIATFNSDNRFVSANIAAGPDVAGSDNYFFTECVPINTHRAYTTSSSIDDQAITLEMSNIAMGGDYPVGPTGKSKLVRVIADAHTLLGMPLERSRVLSHRDVYAAGWGSYATACPGNDLQRYIDIAIDLARDAVRTPTTTPTETPWELYEKEMNMLTMIVANDTAADPKQRWAVHGPGYWRVITSPAAATGAAERVGNAAPVFWSEWDAAWAAAVSSGFVPAPGQDSRTTTPTVVRVNA